MEYIAFFCAVEHNHYDYLEETLKEYDIGLYLMAAEVAKDTHVATKGQHFHFLVQMNDKDYHKFSKRVFTDKFKLAGRAGNGKARQYGRIKKIEDLERLAAYTVKDGNIRSNMSDEQLKSYTDSAFKNEERKDFRDKVMQHLVTRFEEYHLCTKEKFYKDNGFNSVKTYHIEYPMNTVRTFVINYYRSLPESLAVTKNQIDSHAVFFLMYHTGVHFNDQQVCAILFGNF